MKEWKNVRIQQDLVEEAERQLEKDPTIQSLSEFVSESLRLRLQYLATIENNC